MLREMPYFSRNDNGVKSLIFHGLQLNSCIFFRLLSISSYKTQPALLFKVFLIKVMKSK